MGWMDKLVTGIIIGGAAASIFGLSRTKKWKKIWSKALDATGDCTKKWVSVFGKITVKLISLFQKK
jgi:hypothetical protein